MASTRPIHLSRRSQPLLCQIEFDWPPKKKQKDLFWEDICHRRSQQAEVTLPGNVVGRESPQRSS